jgi:hypothetical protein
MREARVLQALQRDVGVGQEPLAEGYRVGEAQQRAIVELAVLVARRERPELGRPQRLARDEASPERELQRFRVGEGLFIVAVLKRARDKVSIVLAERIPPLRIGDHPERLPCPRIRIQLEG